MNASKTQGLLYMYSVTTAHSAARILLLVDFRFLGDQRYVRKKTGILFVIDVIDTNRLMGLDEGTLRVDRVIRY